MDPRDSYRYRFRVPEFTARDLKIKSTEKKEPNRKLEYTGGILGLLCLLCVFMMYGLRSGTLASLVASLVYESARYWSRRDRERLIATVVLSALIIIFLYLTET